MDIYVTLCISRARWMCGAKRIQQRNEIESKWLTRSRLALDVIREKEIKGMPSFAAAAAFWDSLINLEIHWSKVARGVWSASVTASYAFFPIFFVSISLFILIVQILHPLCLSHHHPARRVAASFFNPHLWPLYCYYILHSPVGVLQWEVLAWKLSPLSLSPLNPSNPNKEKKKKHAGGAKWSAHWCLTYCTYLQVGKESRNWREMRRRISRV